MKSFGIGLALLVGGFAAYFLTNALKKAAAAITSIGEFLQKLAGAGFLPEGVTLPEEFGSQIVAAVTGMPQSLINVAPYICLGIMVFGVAWFWLIEPVLYLAAPPKKEAGRETPPVPSAAKEPRAEPMAPSSRGLELIVKEGIIQIRAPQAEPMAPSSRDLEQWVVEAIREKMERERGK